MWRPWETENAQRHEEGGAENTRKRVRVTVGELEKKFIVQCYNQCHGKQWSHVLMHVKQHVLAAGLPSHVVDMYLSQPEERLTGRMSRIIKQSLQTNSTQAISGASLPIQDSPSVLVDSHMRYAKQSTPNQRKADALKRKLYNELVVSSDSSDDGGLSGNEEENEHNQSVQKTKKIKKANNASAQEAHTKMCAKALETMNSVQNLLSKVDKILDKSNK